MLHTYEASCSSCDARFSVKYGRETKTKSYEIYSCPTCKNLFSLSNHESFQCPSCGNKNDLLRYNMNKKENIEYTEKMYDEGLIGEQKKDLLVDYWEEMLSRQCPKCGTNMLEWSRKL